MLPSISKTEIWLSLTFIIFLNINLSAPKLITFVLYVFFCTKIHDIVKQQSILKYAILGVSVLILEVALSAILKKPHTYVIEIQNLFPSSPNIGAFVDLWTWKGPIFLFYPQLYWIFLRSELLTVLEIFAMSIFPRWVTLYLVTVRYGYTGTNPILIVILTIVAVLSTNFSDLFGFDVRHQHVIHAPNEKENVLTILQNPSEIMSYNTNQLESLKGLLIEGLNTVSKRLAGRPKRDENDRSKDVPSEKECVICMNSPPTIKFYPCLHSCVCEECFEKSLGEYKAIYCYVCKLQVIEWENKSVPHGIVMNDDDYKIETQKCTERELAKLYSYIESHPEERLKLK